MDVGIGEETASVHTVPGPMTDIFISYARATESEARKIAEALRTLGYGVWRDDELPPHRAYAEVIEERLKAAKAVVVIWSADAVKSQWVQSEADRGRDDNKLVQLSFDATRPPMPFDRTQCADLSGWTGDPDAPGWRKVVASIAELVGRVGVAAAPASPSVAQTPLPLPSKPSIVVMPFANLSGDAEQDYFADGMMVEITNALSRIKSIFVIASGSALTFKGRAADPQSVSRQLGVRFLLEGSVRKAGGRVRIAVQLIDAIDAVQVWASRFEDSLDDVFDLQDRVALEVAGKIEPTVRQAEIRRASKGPTENIGCYDLYLRALPALSSAARAELLQARDLLDRAIALDPDYGVALSSAALCRFLIVNFGWSGDEPGDRRRSVELAHAAIRAAGDDGEVLTQVIGIVAFLEGDFDAALRLADKALELNPGSPEAWAASGVLRLDPEIALQHLERSMRLDPIGPSRIAQLLGMARAHFLAERFSEAVPYLRELTRQAESNPGAFFMLAAACGQLREMDAAREALDRFKSLTPLTPAEFTQLWTLGIPPKFVKLYLDGIALAESGRPVDGPSEA
ncbi:MAG TPA: TIR domain-containing protein [Caulobacteraceae bacterium]|nr:TIR domain-containing protein [Caulobacteraceae bacterium]